MDQLKKIIPIVTFLLALLLGSAVFFTAPSAAYAADDLPQEMVTVYGVSGYQSSDLSGEPIAFFEGGKTVTVLAAEGQAYRIALDGDTAWVAQDALIIAVAGESFVYEQRRITATAGVREIYFYAAPDRNGAILGKLSDGAKVIQYGQQGDYVAVVYGEQRGWVLQQHVTKGLSYNQFLAVVILSVTFGAAILIGLLLYFRRALPHAKK